MMRRSRLERASTGGRTANSAFCRSATLPGERCVLTVVAAAGVVPIEAERMNVTARGAGQREPVGGRMAGIVEMQRLLRARIKTHRTFGSHVQKPGCLHGPRDAVPLR